MQFNVSASGPFHPVSLSAQKPPVGDGLQAPGAHWYTTGTGWLACTMQRPLGRDLGDYPLFQGLNVVAIAISGCLAVRVQARRLLAERGLRAANRWLLLGSWMAVSLAVGGQTAWYLRPFFGATPLGDVTPPFCDGTAPDFRGARSFYEAVWNLVVPPAGWH